MLSSHMIEYALVVGFAPVRADVLCWARFRCRRRRF
jgi:hypothetical protein